MDDPHIRPLLETDLHEVAVLFRETFNALGETWSETSAYEHIAQSYAGDAQWVAEKDGKIVGFLMGMILVREPGKELFIDNIVVDASYQNQGIGKLLWARAEDYVSHNALTGIRLMAHPSFESYAWYKNQGFIETGWTELYKPSSK